MKTSAFQVHGFENEEVVDGRRDGSDESFKVTNTLYLELLGGQQVQSAMATAVTLPDVRSTQSFCGNIRSLGCDP